MTNIFRTPMVAFWTTAASITLAGLLIALAMTAHEAGATYPGNNGRIAFASDRTTGEGVTNPEGDFEIFTMDRNGTDLNQLTANAATDFDPEWSPDGKRIAFQSDRDLFSNIYVMNADGSRQTRVTSGPAFDRSATFSPDGKTVVFDSNLEAGEGVDNPEGDFEIFAVGADGGDLAQLTKNAENDLQPDFSPDGKKISFVSHRNFAPGIYTMSAHGKQQKKVSRGPAVVFQSPGFSPDGERIAFVSDEDGPLNVYTMRADGKGQVRLTDDPAGDFTPDWQPLK